MKRHLLSVVVVTVLATGTVGLVAAPAEAAIPTCSSWSWFWGSYHPQWIFRMPTVGSQTQSTYCELKYGDRDPDPYYWGAVNVLQYALNECYGQSLDVDGIFGLKTQQAVMNVQRRIGVSVDGRAGPQTKAAMSWPVQEAAVLGGSDVGCLPANASW